MRTQLRKVFVAQQCNIQVSRWLYLWKILDAEKYATDSVLGYDVITALRILLFKFISHINNSKANPQMISVRRT